ncbi:hypothetical protein UPYG_G00210520 [Umbra pygmaea]|uniref:SH3 domain containing ring finger 2 n=1 Tax=Umbra pygmaea TaxID=75934 RepID=A0ABD0X7I6_UMBPY
MRTHADTDTGSCTSKMEELAFLDLLHCPLCLEQLDVSAKVLPCQHTFCKPCLQRHETSRPGGQILTNCPECHTPVQARSVEELPPNLLLVQLLERINQESTEPDGDRDGQTDSESARYMFPSVGEDGLPRKAQQRSSQQSNQQRERPPGQIEVFARALYNHNRNIPEVLNMVSGEIVILREKVDENWYYGETDSSSGLVAASMIEIIKQQQETQQQSKSQSQMQTESQSQPVAACRALFDFDLKDMDVDLGNCKNCLTFQKGDLLTVIRRVDENWIEGKLRDKAGIFPLKFTEPNAAAAAKLLEGRTRQGSDSSADSRPRIGSGLINIGSTDSTNPNRTAQSGAPLSPTRNLPALNPPINIPGKSQVSLSSALYQRNQAQSSSSSSFYKTSQAPQPAPINATFQSNSGQGQAPSISALNSLNHQGPQGYNSLPAHPSVPPVTHSLTHPTNGNSQRVRRSSENTAKRFSQHGERKMSSGEAPPTITMALTNPQNPSASIDTKQSSTQHLSISVCAALYSYKPRRSEELELRKGEMVGVYGNFKEGWLRGLSLRTGKVGILPGNYVTPVLRTSARLLESRAVTAGTGTVPGKRTTSTKTPAMVLALDRVNSDGTSYSTGQQVPPASMAPQPVTSSGGATRQSLHGVGLKGWDTVRRVFRASHRGLSHRGKQYSHTISSSSAFQTHSQNSSQNSSQRGNHYPNTTTTTSGLQPQRNSQNFSHIQAPGYSPALLRRKQHMSLLPNHNRKLAWITEGPAPSSGGFMKDRDTAAREAFDKQVLETKQAASNGNGLQTIHSILVKPDAYKNNAEKPTKSVRFVTQPDSPPLRPRTTSLPSGSQPPSSARPGPLPLEVWAPSLTLGRDGPGIILKEGKAPVLRKGLETYPSPSDGPASNQKPILSPAAAPPGSTQSNSPSRHRVVKAYQAQAESEMSLKQGEPVLVHRHRPDGRVLLTQESSGHTGLFHSSVLQFLDRFS